MFLVPKIANLTILYSCTVLKTFNHHLNHQHKFTIIIRLYTIIFDAVYASSILSSPLFSLNSSQIAIMLNKNSYRVQKQQ